MDRPDLNQFNCGKIGRSFVSVKAKLAVKANGPLFRVDAQSARGTIMCEFWSEKRCKTPRAIDCFTVGAAVRRLLFHLEMVG